MAHTVKLDSLNLHDGVNFAADRPTFQQPPQRAEIRDHFQDDGGVLVAGTDNYGVVTHTIPVWCLAGAAGTIDSLMANIRTLQQKVLKRGTVLEFKFDGATNTNYAEVLYAYCDDPYSSEKWDYWIAKGKRVPVKIHLVCKPFWRGALVTSTQTSLTASPIEVQVTPQGDVETPIRFWIDPEEPSTSEFQNYYVGATTKNTNMSLIYEETSGQWGTNTSDSTAHGGSYNRTAVNNAGYNEVGNVTGYTRIAMMEGVDPRKFGGRFRLLARMRTADVSPTTVQLTWAPYFGFTSIAKTPLAGTVTIKPFTTANTWTLVDFGVVSIPPGMLTESYAHDPSVDNLSIFAKGSSATSYNLDFDFWVLVPLESAFYFRPKVKDAINGWEAYLVDGLGEDVHISEVDPLDTYREAMRWPGGVDITGCGSPIVLKPGETNRIVVLSHIDGPSYTSLRKLEFTYAYYPRYLSPVR